MSKEVKQMVVAEWAGRFKTVQDCVFLSYQGIPAERVRTLRSRLRQEGAALEVLQNSLAVRAFQEAGLPGLADFVKGPTAVAYGEDGAGVAKAIAGWAEEAAEAAKKLRILGGALGRRPVGAAEVQVLASLPDRRTLQAQVLAAVLAPATQVANLLEATLSQVLKLFVAHIDKKEKEGGP